MRPTRRFPVRCRARLAGALIVGAGTLFATAPGATAAPIADSSGQANDRATVTLLGDSVFAGLATRGALDGLRSTFDVTLDARVCRRTVARSCTAGGQTPNTGIEAMQQRQGSLGDVLVVGLGYNDDGNHFDVAVDALMAEASAQQVPRVIWLTMRTERFAAPNAALWAARVRHPTLEVVDWDAASAGHDNWFAADGLHLGAGGRAGLAAFISEHLEQTPLARCSAGTTAIGAEPTSNPASSLTNEAVPVDGRVHLIMPTRLIDTRTGPNARPLSAGKVIELPVTAAAIGHAAPVPADAVAAIMNVTAVDACADGFLTVFPCGSPVPTASNLNVTASGTVANLVTVALGDGRACISSMITTDIVVDLAGWYGPAGASMSPVTPRRIIDSRDGTGRAAGFVDANSAIAFDIASALGSTNATPTSGVAINITATQPQGDGFITVFACGQDRPTASNVNYANGQTVSNMAIVALATDGLLCFYTHARTHLIVDVFAVIGSDDASAERMSVRSPNRIVDTRIGLGAPATLPGPGPLAAQRQLTIPLDPAIPAAGGTAGVSDALLAVLNVTAVHPTGDGWIAAYPCGTTVPEISNVNFVAGSITPGHVVVAVGASGSVCITSMVTTDVVVDLIGWSRATSTAAMSTAATRRLFSPAAIDRAHCSTRPGRRQSMLTLPSLLDRDRRANPWRWPSRATPPARCQSPA